MSRLHHCFSYSLLLGARGLARTFYRFEVTWIGRRPEEPWQGVRVAALLNHTSLYEWLFTAVPPPWFLRRLATQGVLPSADKTMERPLVGRFFYLLAGKVVSITRERDETWDEVLRSIGPDSLVLIAPEGRMKRLTGLDLAGRPMTVRGGIADILQDLGRGTLLIGYSGGLHHVQAPGQRLPRLFKTIRMAIESVDIAGYLATFDHAPRSKELKEAIKADLERRRDLYCPTEGETYVQRRQVPDH